MSASLEEERDLPVTTQFQVYTELRQMLMEGTFEPGQRLVVRDLAARFNASSMPVREALRRLESEDALIDIPNRGIAVPPIDVEAVSDLVRIRCMIEGSAAEWAAATMTGAELAAISELNDRMYGLIEVGQKDELLRLNREFHFSIYRAARSRVLMQVIERLWLRAGPWLNILREDVNVRLAFDHHKEIVAALRAGDGPRARRAVALDLADAGDVITRRVLKPSELHPASGRGRE